MVNHSELIDINEIFRINKELNLPEHDLLLVADGSGTIAANCCGWACIAFDTIKTEITIHNGSMSCGSNNFAEIIPFLQALWLYDAQRDAVAMPHPRVQIISDSEVSVKHGNREYTRKANGCLWGAFDWFESVGYKIRWNHVHRNTNLLSKKCDWLAGQSRCNLETLRLRLLEGNRKKVLTGK